MNQEELLEKLKKENELLVMKLRLKEKYIKELEAELQQRKRPAVEYEKTTELEDMFVAVDIETTGLSPDFHDMFQIALVLFKDGQPVDQFVKYFRPTRLLTKKIKDITGISNEFLEDKDFIQKDDIETIYQFIGDKLIVSHSAPFAMKFILRYADDFDIEKPKLRVLDTLPLSRKQIKNTPNHKLETLKQQFNLGDTDSHDALNDAKATGYLALMLNTMTKNN